MISHLIRPAVITGLVASAALGASVTERPDWSLTRANGPSTMSLNDSANVPLNTPGIIERSLCVGIGLLRNGSYQCGDLVVAYPMQAVRVNGRTYQPALIHNGQLAHPVPQIALDIATPSGTTTPDSIRYIVSVNGAPRDSSVTLTNSQLSASPSVRRRIHVGWDAYLDATDVYPVSIEARSYYPGGATYSTTQTTEAIVVNRGNSRWGMGWWVSGVEMLMTPSNNSANRLWVGGDGSARIYRPTGTNNEWVADLVDRPDTLKSNGTTYSRMLPGGTSVVFNAQGQHINTVDARGFTTTLYYASSSANAALDSMKVPKLSKPYYFKYKTPTTDSSALDSAFSPAPSGFYKLRAKSYGRVMYQIFDQRGTDEYYDIYQSGINVGRILYRRERGGREAYFRYDSAAQLSRVISNVDASGRLDTTKICSYFTYSRTTSADSVCNTRVNLVPNAVISMNGPRPDATDPDSVQFRVGRFGAPNRVRNALNNITSIERDAASGCNSFPAFVTKVTTPDNIVTTACPDARGNVSTNRVLNGLGAGSDQITTYVWDQTWDKVKSVSNAIGQLTFVATYNAFGEPDSVTDGRLGSATKFYYGGSGNALKLLEESRTPVTRGVAIEKDIFTYDALGNVTGTYGYTDSTSAVVGRLNVASHATQDAIGRTINACSDISNLTGSPVPQKCTSTIFDIMARDSVVSTIAPNPSQYQTLTTIFDGEGRPHILAREGSNTPSPMYTIYNYDRAGNQTSETAPDGYVSKKIFDKAHNVIASINRRGDTVKMGYDGANQLKWKVVPTVTVASTTPTNSIGASSPTQAYPWLPNVSTSYQMAKDSMWYQYDVAGRMTVAGNTDTRVLRTYNALGLLETDSAYIRNNQGGFQKYGIQHRYDGINRQVAMKVPSQLAVGTTDSITYIYHPLNSDLLVVTGLNGTVTTFNYTITGQNDIVSSASGLTENKTFDAAGNLVRSLVQGGGTIGTLRKARYTYDNRGLLLTVRDSSSYQETNTYTYSGMGHVKTSLTLEVAKAYYGSSSLGNATYQTVDTMYNNGYGSVDSSLTGTATTVPSSSGYSTLKNTYNGSGRLMAAAAGAGNSRFYMYDADGNTTFYQQAASTMDDIGFHEDRYSYYDAENRLRAADYRGQRAGLSTPFLVFEQYKYDALGRRVWTRADRYCDTSDWASFEIVCNLSTLTRTVWDGDHELAEMRVPVKLVNNTAMPDTLIDNDQYLPNLGRSPHGFDQNPYFGRVIYTHGLVVDQPLAVTRYNYVDLGLPNATTTNKLSFATATLEPSWDFKGRTTDITCSTGAHRCAGTRTGGATDSMFVFVPGNYFVYERSRATRYVWHGSLLEDKEGAARTLYRRNRVYDPAAGRFTQEDPIGLAGGLNLYGYAGGDPVNFSDPSGLCFWDACVVEVSGAYVLWGGIAAIASVAWIDFNNRYGSSAFGAKQAAEGSVGGPTAGRRATATERRDARARNREANDGDLKCVYCGVSTPEQAGQPTSSEIDHTQPRNPRDGGPKGNNSKENLENTCRTCNRNKSNKRPPFTAPVTGPPRT